MHEWWTGLTILQQVFLYAAVPATLILVIQTIMLLVGLGQGGSGMPEGGMDSDGAFDDIDVDDGVFGDAYDLHDVSGVEAPDAGLSLFTVRGIITFFSIFGWGGLAISRSGANDAASILVALLLGSVAMLLMAMALRSFSKLQSSGNISLDNALGKSGSVYITIPANRENRGKVSLLVQERLGEFDAVTDEEGAIHTGEEVTVVGISNRNTVVVKRKK